jgi:hypothetical protein
MIPSNETRKLEVLFVLAKCGQCRLAWKDWKPRSPVDWRELVLAETSQCVNERSFGSLRSATERGLCAYQVERLLPARPDPTSPLPELRVDSGHPRSEVTSLEDPQLLPEDLVFQVKVATGTKEAASKPGDPSGMAKHELQFD